MTYEEFKIELAKLLRDFERGLLISSELAGDIAMLAIQFGES